MPRRAPPRRVASPLKKIVTVCLVIVVIRSSCAPRTWLPRSRPASASLRGLRAGLASFEQAKPTHVDRGLTARMRDSTPAPLMRAAAGSSSSSELKSSKSRSSSSFRDLWEPHWAAARDTPRRRRRWRDSTSRRSPFVGGRTPRSARSSTRTAAIQRGCRVRPAAQQRGRAELNFDLPRSSAGGRSRKFALGVEQLFPLAHPNSPPSLVGPHLVDRERRWHPLGGARIFSPPVAAPPCSSW